MTIPKNLNKRYVIIIGGGVITLGLVALFLGFQQDAAQQANRNVDTASLTNAPDQSGGLPNTQTNQPSPTVVQITPDIIAKRFYDWYVNHPNPLGSGDYLTNADITPEYKKNMGKYVARGDHLNSDPVMNCQDGKAPKIVVTQPPVYEAGGLRAYVFIAESSAAQPLYKVILHNVGNNWLIKDVWCAN